MLIYHFLKAGHGLDNIRNRRLKISRIMELNDPFEFLGVDLSDREIRKAFKKIKLELSENNGLLCFSENWTNPVLWGHYAEKHTGLCLAFEVPKSMAEMVNYESTRFSLPESIDEEFMRKLLFTKFKHWEYEEEYRVFTQLDDEINGIYFSEFSNELRLKKVIVGAQSIITRSDVAIALGDLAEDVETFKARAGFKKFEVVEQQDNTKWA